jgi:LPS O-antigen subunit length determinant protein (WzzB/FepE family)
MNENYNNDEIDLFDLFESLWGGKRLIGCLVVISTLLGFGYTQLSQPVYRASATYSLNVYSVASQQVCGGGDQMKCVSEVMEQVLSDYLVDSWEVSSKSVSLSTVNPLSPTTYETQLKEYNQKTTAFVKAKALAELQVIENISNDSLLSTERVATNMLNAKRIIQSIDSGQSVISFGPVEIAKVAPRSSRILAISIVLGGMVGCVIVLLRNAIRNREISKAQA